MGGTALSRGAPAAVSAADSEIVRLWEKAKNVTEKAKKVGAEKKRK